MTRLYTFSPFRLRERHRQAPAGADANTDVRFRHWLGKPSPYNRIPLHYNTSYVHGTAMAQLGLIIKSSSEGVAADGFHAICSLRACERQMDFDLWRQLSIVHPVAGAALSAVARSHAAALSHAWSRLVRTLHSPTAGSHSGGSQWSGRAKANSLKNRIYCCQGSCRMWFAGIRSPRALPN